MRFFATKIFVASLLLGTAAYPMEQCPIMFPVNKDINIIIYSFIFDLANPSALIKSIKQLCKMREICKEFDGMIHNNIIKLLVQRLERHGLKITDIVTAKGYSVLHDACVENNDIPILAMILLQAAGADALSLLKMKADDYCAPLFFATREKKINIIRVMLHFAGDQASELIMMQHREQNKITALKLAVALNAIEITKLFLYTVGDRALPGFADIRLYAEISFKVGPVMMEINGMNGSEEMINLLIGYQKRFEKQALS